MRCSALVLCLIALTSAMPAHAFCSYRDKMYAKTTIPQEMRDAKWVVKAKVEAADYHWAEGESWTVYTVRVLDRFKGSPARTFRLFTFRDSGGFYLDKGTVPDLGTDYLLFLVPPTQIRPRGVTNVVQVNYECGQSKPWADLSPADQAALRHHAAR